MEFVKERTACISGYRPNKFDFPLNGNEYDLFIIRLLDEIEKAIESGYDTFLVGMAPGMDIITGELLILMKRSFTPKEIKIVCALPYDSFRDSEHFDEYWRKRYNHVIAHSHETINVTGKDCWIPSCYYMRNKFMVDNSSLLLCYFTGKRGGTEMTVQYAKKNSVKVVNIA